MHTQLIAISLVNAFLIASAAPQGFIGGPIGGAVGTNIADGANVLPGGSPAGQSPAKDPPIVGPNQEYALSKSPDKGTIGCWTKNPNTNYDGGKNTTTTVDACKPAIKSACALVDANKSSTGTSFTAKNSSCVATVYVPRGWDSKKMPVADCEAALDLISQTCIQFNATNNALGAINSKGFQVLAAVKSSQFWMKDETLPAFQIGTDSGVGSWSEDCNPQSSPIVVNNPDENGFGSFPAPNPNAKQPTIKRPENQCSRCTRQEDSGEPSSRAVVPGSDAQSVKGRLSPTTDDLQQLSSDESNSGASSPVDRIAEHERASSHGSESPYDGPSFKIVSRSTPGDDDVVLIDSFPNEVLTHIMSHLPPPSLMAMSLVSHRFHALVTTPHAWRIAFSRYFPGIEATRLVNNDGSRPQGAERAEVVRLSSSDRRVFTRLTALASWRSEYILRTRLLRSLARGRPHQVSPPSKGPPSRSSQNQFASSAVTYNSQLYTSVTNLEATFAKSGNKKFPRFIHGADDAGSACSSDPAAGKVDKWGFSDPQSFVQFAERNPGDAQWGLGAGDVVGLPNSMDLSQPYGMIYGEGSPGGLIYFRSADEMRGRCLSLLRGTSAPELGIPGLIGAHESICSVWIAKTSSVPLMTDGLVGMLTGSSAGVLTAYSLGTDGLRDQRLHRGEITARWAISPGVPIIAIAADDACSVTNRSRNRMWAVVLNALGEVYYLTSPPRRARCSGRVKIDDEELRQLAWQTGRTVRWDLIEQTRRVARDDPYGDHSFDHASSPRAPWDGTPLSRDQMVALTHDIEKYIGYRPKHFRRVCKGWDMRRKLEVDFAGHGSQGSGPSVIVIQCGVDPDTAAGITRFCAVLDGVQETSKLDSEQRTTPRCISGSSTPSLGGSASDSTTPMRTRTSSRHSSTSRSSSSVKGAGSLNSLRFEWRTSDMSFGSNKDMTITATALDNSMFAVLEFSDDPLLTMSGMSMSSSPLYTPQQQSSGTALAVDVPGQRARLMAVGTDGGAVIVWNVRGPTASKAGMLNTLAPVRIIQTDSPQISCLAVTALYLVHGGNDGLVQAWDPLASSSQPIRTLNSRFSSRARRRLVQVEANAQEVGINMFAAGAVCLDPDPTVLRGMVSLGTYLRYWSYSSSATDQYARRKRRVRRSQRGSNGGGGGGDRFSNTSRSALKDYITDEKREMEHERASRRREMDRLAGRFGVGLLGDGASEEQELAYARLLSEETFAQDESRRRSSTEDAPGSDSATVTVTPEGSVVAAGSSSSAAQGISEPDVIDADVAEAIRLSLLDSPSASASASLSSADVTEFVAQSVKSPESSSMNAEAVRAADADDLDLGFALQLSLAEERSRQPLHDTKRYEEEEEFPVLGSSSPSSSSSVSGGKGKGNDRAW
ncbi:MAG: hypothetical protein M1825_003206 [Sarcosagium campestre]|nr:MAG: hypothetical protein M1825_003206 [Sarcosagium campestre]